MLKHERVKTYTVCWPIFTCSVPSVMNVVSSWKNRQPSKGMAVNARTSPCCVTYLWSVRLCNLLDNNLRLRLARRLGCRRSRHRSRARCCHGTHRRSYCCCCWLLDWCRWGLYCQIYLRWTQHTLLSCCCLCYNTNSFTPFYWTINVNGAWIAQPASWLHHRLTTKEPESHSQQVHDTLLFPIMFIANLRPTLSPIQRILGAISLGKKLSGWEADHSPLSSVKVENAWRYISTPLHIFMAWCLIRHKDNLISCFHHQKKNWKNYISPYK
jgi:hypothetical protein